MKPRANAGLTLVELMVALTIFGMVSTGLATFYLESLQTSYVIHQQLGLVSEMRNFSNEMLYTAGRAHEIVLYRSSADADRVDVSSREQIAIEDETDSLICPTGNFVVFVYYELPKPSHQSRYRIARLIGYSLDLNDANVGTLSRITVDLTASPSTDSVEEILRDHWTDAPRKNYSRFVAPLALADNVDSTATPRLFYKRSEQNLAVCGQFLKSEASVDTKDRRTLTRTMYFTVTTRS